MTSADHDLGLLGRGLGSDLSCGLHGLDGGGLDGRLRGLRGAGVPDQHWPDSSAALN